MKRNKLSIRNSFVFMLLILLLVAGSCKTEEKAVTTITPVDSTSQYTSENLKIGKEDNYTRTLPKIWRAIAWHIIGAS